MGGNETERKVRMAIEFGSHLGTHDTELKLINS